MLTDRDVVDKLIEAARAEGYCAGLERAAERCHEEERRCGEDPAYSAQIARVACGRCVAAIRALAPVPDATAEPGWEPRDPRPWIRDILEGAVESIAREIEKDATGATLPPTEPPR